MTTLTCQSCGGRRREINGCGMRVDCTHCGGSGVVDISINNDPAEAIKQIPEPLRRKPGRKPQPKVVND